MFQSIISTSKSLLLVCGCLFCPFLLLLNYIFPLCIYFIDVILATEHQYSPVTFQILLIHASISSSRLLMV